MESLEEFGDLNTPSMGSGCRIQMNSAIPSSQPIKGRGEGKAERAVTRMEAALVVEGTRSMRKKMEDLSLSLLWTGEINGGFESRIPIKIQRYIRLEMQQIRLVNRWQCQDVRDLKEPRRRTPAKDCRALAEPRKQRYSSRNQRSQQDHHRLSGSKMSSK